MVNIRVTGKEGQGGTQRDKGCEVHNQAHTRRQLKGGQGTCAQTACGCQCSLLADRELQVSVAVSWWWLLCFCW